MKKHKKTLNEMYEAIERSNFTGYLNQQYLKDKAKKYTDDKTNPKPVTTNNSNSHIEDTEAANRIKIDMMDTLEDIGVMFNRIDGSLSSFNSPGLRQAFQEAIRKGMSNNRFNADIAMKQLEIYFQSK